MNDTESDSDSCSTISFRNEELISDFILKNEAMEAGSFDMGIKTEANSADLEVKIGENFDGEDRYLARRLDPCHMTARQRSLLGKRTGILDQSLEADSGSQQSGTAESLPSVPHRRETVGGRHAAETRRGVVRERQRQEQRATVERLLRVTSDGTHSAAVGESGSAARRASTAAAVATADTPYIRVDKHISDGITISYSHEDSVPVRQLAAVQPIRQQCCVPGCINPRSYACSATGRPLCRKLQCYKQHMATSSVQSSQPLMSS